MTVHQLPNGTLEILEDGTKIQKTHGGVTLCARPDGTKVQTQADGTRLVVHPDGSKVQTSVDGTIQEVGVDGKITQTRPTGLVLEVWPDGRKRQTDTTGIIVDVAVDGSRIQTNLDGTKIEILADGTQLQHMKDGSIIEVDAKTGKIIRIVKVGSINGDSPASKQVTDANKTPMKPHYYDETSGAWYEHDPETGKTRWLTADEQVQFEKSSGAGLCSSDTYKSEATVSRSLKDMNNISSVEKEFQKSLREMQIKLNASNEKIGALQTSLHEAKEEQNAIRQSYEHQLHQTLAENRTIVSTLQEEIQNLKIMQSSNHVSSVSRDEDAAAAKVLSLEAEISEMRGFLKEEQMLRTNAVADLASTNGVLKTTREHLEKAREKARQTEVKLHDSNIELQNLRLLYEDVVEKAGKVAEEVTSLKRLLDESANAYDASIKEITRLEEVIATKASDANEGSHEAKPMTPGSIESQLKASEKMIAAVMNRLDASQRELSQTRNTLEEMHIRRESSEHLMRKQRTAIRKRDIRIQELHEELEECAAAHAKQVRKVEKSQRTTVENMINKISQLEAKLANAATARDSKPSSLESNADLSANASLLRSHSSQMVELEQIILARDAEIAQIRKKLTLLSSENGKLQSKLDSEERDSILTMEALKFFDMPSFAPLEVKESNVDVACGEFLASAAPIKQGSKPLGKPKRPQLSGLAPPMLSRMRSRSKSVNSDMAEHLMHLSFTESRKSKQHLLLASVLDENDS